ncbi:MAG: UDP-glucose 4-epimerase GalE [Elusimicrobia bacterium]|nr:UDP-glucose 4-epimerase GalE [Elusimicrobiota bacterium]
MKILVTGGAGYIGSHVVLALLEAGHSVRVFDDMSTGAHENLFSEVEFIKGTMLDIAQMQKAAEGVDAVIHMAAKKAVGESMENPQIYARNNICGDINVLNAIAQAGVKYFVFSSSSAVYGNAEKMPIDETAPLKPESFYGFTKLQTECLLPWYYKLKGVKFASLRYFNAVGYDGKGRARGKEINPQNLLPVVLEAAAGIRSEVKIFGSDYPTADGTCVRDYVHVTDLADAHSRALNFLAGGGQNLCVNLGTEGGHSVLEVVKRAAEITQKEIKYSFAPRREGDPAVVRASSALAEKTLGWKAVNSGLDNIIKTMWEIYK